MTGRIPLLLRSLPEFNDGRFDAAEFLDSRELQLVRDDIVSFYRKIFSDKDLSEGDHDQ